MLSPQAFPYGISFAHVVFPDEFPLRIFFKEPTNASKCILRNFHMDFPFKCIQVPPGASEGKSPKGKVVKKILQEKSERTILKLTFQRGILKGLPKMHLDAPGCIEMHLEAPGCIWRIKENP